MPPPLSRHWHLPLRVAIAHALQTADTLVRDVGPAARAHAKVVPMGVQAVAPADAQAPAAANAVGIVLEAVKAVVVGQRMTPEMDGK